jgi:hypothetical protein
MALAALAVTLAWVTAGGQASAAPVARQAPAALAAAQDPATGEALIAQSARVAHEAAARQAAAVLAAHTYTVRAGDSISTVAVRRCGQAKKWTGIYAASRARGWTAKNANALNTGQHLYLSCTYDARQLRFAPAPPPPPVLAVAAVATARTGGAYHRTYRQAASSGSYGNVNPGSYSGFEACVIARESGGNSQVMNSSGHYGLYQFSSSTWQAYGGSAGSFGRAPASEQRRVFLNAMAQGGQSNWSPYDGC